MIVAVEDGKHHMHELNISGCRLDGKTGYAMPAGMPVMALAPFTNLNRGFNLQAGRFARLLDARIYQGYNDNHRTQG